MMLNGYMRRNNTIFTDRDSLLYYSVGTDTGSYANLGGLMNYSCRMNKFKTSVAIVTILITLLYFSMRNPSI